MSKFFIERPIFAWVIAIVITLAGLLSLNSLSISQFPNVAPPAVAISASYPGASAQTLQDTVAQVIEQNMNGLDGLRYITSESNSDGSLLMIVTFNQGTNPDIAQVQVQNKLQLAMPLLPEAVQHQGIRVVKYQMNIMMVVGLVSEDETMSSQDISDYIVSNLQDPLSRIKGVGDFIVFGSQYAMRIWLNPAQLHSYQLTVSDVIAAISKQNVQVSSGELGGLPTLEGVQLNASIIGKELMTKPEQFEEILLTVNPDGSQVRLKNVATINLGSANFSMSSKYNDKPASGIAIRLASGGNILETTELIRQAITELEPYFPPGIKAVYPYDTSPTVEASIHSVVTTLFEAIFLVFCVMFLFLQNIRSTLVPTMVVPVVLLGTFAMLFLTGFNINNMTMFAMVLAIGLLVDDAIVVVENVSRLMNEEGLSPKEATIKSMQQVQGALVGIGLVISAVFMPMAFFGGATGIIYRQFSITIISTMGLSVFIALTFTPALCATLLTKGHTPKTTGFFGKFNQYFDFGVKHYQGIVTKILNRKTLPLALYVGLTIIAIFLFTRVPTAFLPDEDQGMMMVQIQMPPNSSAERTEVVLEDVTNYLRTKESKAVQGTFSVNGFNMAGRGQMSGMVFVQLKSFDQRNDKELSVFAVEKRANQYFSTIKDAKIVPIIPPSIVELGNSTGFDFYLQDNADLGHAALMAAQETFLQLAAKNPQLELVRANGLPDLPQYILKIDDEKARALLVNLDDINKAMSVAWGSTYVNDFIDRGRIKPVYVQGNKDSRVAPEDFSKWHVRNMNGQMVTFDAFSQGYWAYGSPKLERYNSLPSVEILGQPATGYSSGDAMAEIKKLATQLPKGIGLNYTGLSYEEIASGAQAPALYALSILIVLLCLAALYESWSIPFAVLMVIPFGVLGAVAATLMRGLSNDVFFQVGMLTVMGLAAKNAILIIEFAKDLHEKEQVPIIQAAIQAAHLRVRPILMTSLAFVFGVLPMAIATGASSSSQHSIGNSVVGGTIVSTSFAIFFVPLFYVLISQLFKAKIPVSSMKTTEPTDTTTEPEKTVDITDNIKK